MTKFIFLLLVIGVFLIFYQGVSKVVFGGDSGDIILSYYFGGVAHPPGYPLNTFFGFLLTKLLWGAFAFRANLVSAIYFAISVGLLFLLGYRLTKNLAVSLFGSLTLAFTPLFWLYAHVAEVFQLNILLILISIIFLFGFWSKQSKKKIFLFLSVFFWGLACFHHQTSILLAPAYLYALREQRKNFGNFRDILKIIGSFLLGAVPYLFVFWAASRKTPINWDDPSNFAGFWQLITRADYGSFTAASDLVGFSLMARLVQILWYFKVILADFTAVGIMFILGGFIWLFRNKKQWFWFFALSAFFTGPFFLAYASFPPVDSLLLGISERFLLLNYVFLGVLLIFGMLFFVNLLTNIFAKFIPNKKLIELTLSLSLFLLPFVFILVNWVRSDLSDFKLGEVLAHDVLGSAEPAGIIFLQGDTLTFNTQYSYYVDGISRQSAIVMTGRLRHGSYRNQLIREYPNLVFPQNFDNQKKLEYSDTVIALINSNFNKLPIYSAGAISVPSEYQWVQMGMVNRLFKKDEIPQNSDLTAQIIESLERMRFEVDFIEGRYLNFFDEDIKNLYAGIFVNNAFELLRRGATDDAKEYFDLAISINPQGQSAMFGLGISFYEKKDCKGADDVFRSIVAHDPGYWQAWQGLGQVYKDCYFDEQKTQEYLERSELERKKRYDKPIEEL